MMTKREFIHALCDAEGIAKDDAVKITDMVFGQVQRSILQGREVRINGVGKFKFRFRAAGSVQNNLIGERHDVAARIVLRFSTFPHMKRMLREKLLPKYIEE